MTPLEIEILLHYYTKPGRYGNLEGNYDAPAVLSTHAEFVDKGLLECKRELHFITDKGTFYVEQGFCNIPLPVPKTGWYIPWPK